MLLDWFSFLKEDLQAVVYAFELNDLAYPTYFILWLIILFLPLLGIDRHDPIAGLVYILYLVTTGATLIFALPDNLNSVSDLNIHFSVLVAMGCAAAYRWFHDNNRRQVVLKEENKGETNESKGL